MRAHDHVLVRILLADLYHRAGLQKPHLLDDVDGFCVSEYLVADCYRQIGNERAVHHVAEVDDAGDVLTLGEQVLRVEVVVYHLCPQAGKPRSDQGIESIQP